MPAIKLFEGMARSYRWLTKKVRNFVSVCQFNKGVAKCQTSKL